MPRRDATLTVVSGRETIPLAVGESFDNDNMVLRFARISPNVGIGNEVFDSVHFIKLKFLPNRIDFGFGLSVNLVPGTSYTLSLIDTPEMIPMPTGLNKPISSPNDLCSFQLFRRTDQGPTYVDQSVGPWKHALSRLNDILEENRMDPRNFRVGLVTNANELPEETYLPYAFFEDRSNGRAVMVLLCEPNDSIVFECEGVAVSTHLLPTVPRALARLASRRMNNESVASSKTLLRRIITICINGGVPVDLVNGLGLNIGRNVISLTSFKRADLNWGISSNLKFKPGDFALPKKCFKNLLKSSNEATLGSLFWTAALNAALLPDLESGRLRSLQEFITNSLIAGYGNRRVDYVAALHCLPPDRPDDEKEFYPLLFGEYSRETVSIENYHKDFVKACCMASAFCLSLAYKLIALGRKPELARCFGLLIGGTGARLIMAYPVIEEVNGKFEIQINISSSPIWHFDVTSGDRTGRQIIAGRPMESFVDGDLSFERWVEYDVRTRAGMMAGTTIHFQTVEQEEAQQQRMQQRQLLQSRQQKQLQQQQQQQSLDLGSDELFKRGISDSGLSRIHYIGQLVRDHAALICSTRPDARDTLGRRFKAAPKYGHIPEARPSSLKNTPVTKQIREQRTTLGTNAPAGSNLSTSSTLSSSDSSTPPSPSPRVLVRKPANATELSVYRESTIFLPGFLPRVYEIREKPAIGQVEYTMEQLEPFASVSGTLNSFFAMDGAKEALYSCCKFMLDCLFQLYLVHEQLNLVHSDVSPSNVMYSKADRIWKLIDFNQAMSKAESECTSRVAGTPDFVAPEAEESGRFTVSSDVWSLGQLAFNWLLPGLTMGVYGGDEAFERDDDDDGWMVSCCDEVVDCIVKMVSGHPSDRPTVVESIRLFYSIVRRFDMDKYARDDLVMEGARNLIRSARASEVTSMMPAAATVAKRRFEEVLHEKDPLEAERPGIQ